MKRLKWLLLGSSLAAACGSAGNEPTQMVSSLTGEWDVVASEGQGRPIMGNFSWTEDSITLTLDGKTTTLAFNGDDGMGRNSTRPDVAAVTRTGRLDLGVIPFNIGQSWNASLDTHRGKSCRATLSEVSITAFCGDVGTQTNADFSISIDRHSASPSIFGKMGGTWRYSYEGGCRAIIKDSSVRVLCERTHLDVVDTETVLSMNVEGDVASGRIYDKVEFSARRRL